MKKHIFYCLPANDAQAGIVIEKLDRLSAFFWFLIFCYASFPKKERIMIFGPTSFLFFNTLRYKEFRNTTTRNRGQLALKDNSQSFYCHSRANLLRACQHRLGFKRTSEKRRLARCAPTGDFIIKSLCLSIYFQT